MTKKLWVKGKKHQYFKSQFFMFFFLWNLIGNVSPHSFSYTRTSHCILQTNTGCVYWESQLTLQKKLDSLCFPEETYLQGREGKIKISNIKIGDEVLVYQKNGIGFQKIQAWLHRDVESKVPYNFIGYEVTKGQEKVIQNGFYISGMHNIAIVNNQTAQVQYKFAENLNSGDLLFGYGPYMNSQTPKVTQIGRPQQMRGIYAPYTSSGNYFISSSKASDQLILVHCFAHVSTNYHTAFNFLIGLTPFWNIQPSQASYIHPLSNVLKDLFPSVIEVKKLNHYAQKITEKHDYLYDGTGRHLEHPSYRYEKQSQGWNFDRQRNAIIIIDKILSMVEKFF